MLRAKVCRKLLSHDPSQPPRIEAEVFSSTSASSVPFAGRVSSCGALNWRTKLSHCRRLQTTSWLQCTIKKQHASPCRLVHSVTFYGEVVKESEQVGSWIPVTWEGHGKQILVFWGMHVYTFSCNCKWQTSMPTRWQQANPLQACELQLPSQPNKISATLQAWKGEKLFHKGVRMFLRCKCDLHIFAVFETSVS